VGEQLADMHCAKGKYDDAIVILENLLKNKPSDLILRIKLAHAVTIKGDYITAIKRWKELVQDQPSNTALVKILADAYRVYKDLSLEISGWKDLVEKNPSIQYFQDLLVTAYEARIEEFAPAIISEGTLGSSLKLCVTSPYTLKDESRVGGCCLSRIG
jgi:predicted Zn-dependent protease